MQPPAAHSPTQQSPLCVSHLYVMKSGGSVRRQVHLYGVGLQSICSSSEQTHNSPRVEHRSSETNAFRRENTESSRIIHGEHRTLTHKQREQIQRTGSEPGQNRVRGRRAAQREAGSRESGGRRAACVLKAPGSAPRDVTPSITQKCVSGSDIRDPSTKWSTHWKWTVSAVCVCVCVSSSS